MQVACQTSMVRPDWPCGPQLADYPDIAALPPERREVGSSLPLTQVLALTNRWVNLRRRRCLRMCGTGSQTRSGSRRAAAPRYSNPAAVPPTARLGHGPVPTQSFYSLLYTAAHFVLNSQHGGEDKSQAAGHRRPAERHGISVACQRRNHRTRILQPTVDS